MKIEIKCRDYGSPGCLGEPDEQYTMRFDDLGEPPLYWCSSCGPKVKALHELFEQAVKDRGPEFEQLLDKAITDAENAEKSKQS